MKTFTHAYLDEPITEDDGPWYTLRLIPYYCKDCDATQEFCHILLPYGETVIIIFDQKDDDILLEAAIRYQQMKLDPKVVDYEPDYGVSMSVYDVCKILGVEYEQLLN